MKCTWSVWMSHSVAASWKIASEYFNFGSAAGISWRCPSIEPWVESNFASHSLCCEVALGSFETKLFFFAQALYSSCSEFQFNEWKFHKRIYNASCSFSKCLWHVVMSLTNHFTGPCELIRDRHYSKYQSVLSEMFKMLMSTCCSLNTDGFSHQVLSHCRLDKRNYWHWLSYHHRTAVVHLDWCLQHQCCQGSHHFQQYHSLQNQH